MLKTFLNIVFVLSLPSLVFAGIADSKHNLSISGPGTIKASEESQICLFCHTPHNANPRSPLWNRANPGITYAPYSSSTIQASPGQPTGSSILCLSCHDGTIALGELLNQQMPIPFEGNQVYMPSGSSRLGTDLSDDHPVSFVYSNALALGNSELAHPNELPREIKLDDQQQLQCTSCHDPHDNPYGKFLVMPHRNGQLCTACHRRTHWNSSSHARSTATWNGSGENPWPNGEWNSVAEYACMNCHRPHNAASEQHLLHAANEEANCLKCHNSNVAEKNIEQEFNKFSHHPITATNGVHDTAETHVIKSRHVECVDCHNPHVVGSSVNQLGLIAGVKGVSITGELLNEITQEQELCFRCHGDSPNKPPPYTQRQLEQTNVRLEFNSSNPSYHPIGQAGANPNVPSLISPLNEDSVIQCTDCHNSDNATQVNGPHGSSYSPILKAQYLTQFPTSESPAAYALCYQCHDRNSILGNRSFSRHSLHIAGMGGDRINAPCNVCHDPHGVSFTQGNSQNNSKLINFDTNVVRPNSAGILRFESTGTFSGRCYLMCHGENHNPESYPMGGGGGGGQ